MTYTVQAQYQNHNNWPSPIFVEDLESWKATYGTTVPLSVRSIDYGKFVVSVWLKRAGTYTIDVLIDGVNVPDSLLYQLEVEPTTLDASTSVPRNVPEIMYAGFDYQF